MIALTFEWGIAVHDLHGKLLRQLSDPVRTPRIAKQAKVAHLSRGMPTGLSGTCQFGDDMTAMAMARSAERGQPVDGVALGPRHFVSCVVTVAK